MEVKLKNYLTHAGLAIADAPVDQIFTDHLRVSIASASDETINWETIFTYPVPKLSPDGSCSIHGELEKKPYDLRNIFHNVILERSDRISPVAATLFRLNRMVECLHTETQSDWTGIYLVHACHPELAEGSLAHASHCTPALIKLAYRGRPSRAEFPLTQEFARHSNNSTVGLSGKAVLIQNVREHIDTGKPYYECDASVKSELCLPIFSNRHPEPARFAREARRVEGSPTNIGHVIGILDLESFHKNHFTVDKVSKVALTCLLASHLLQQVLPMYRRA